MQRNTGLILIIFVYFFAAGRCGADCPLDHFMIGCNPDDIIGTGDDNELFVDCTQKYRHSDPQDSGGATWLYWHYPLYYNPRYDRWQIGEPGYDTIKNDDPNRCLEGTAGVDYQIFIECVSIKPGFMAKNAELAVEFNKAGDAVCHSSLPDTHLHLEYRASVPAGATDLQWITFIIYDQLGTYEPSQPFSIVFVKDPPAGDLVIDGVVDADDLSELCFYWLHDKGDKSNDYYERADTDRDGYVDFSDFSRFALNWLKVLE